MLHKLPRTIKTAALSIAALLLSACDGGIIGSGNGGGTPLPTGTPTLPSIERYALRNLPDDLLVDLPTSLLAVSDRDYTDEPYTLTASQLRKITAQQIEIGLLRLVTDANWDQIVEHCQAIPLDTQCNLDQSSIETPYTEGMAQWEIEQRTRFEELLNGTTPLSAEKTSEISLLARSRIGSMLSVNGGTFTTNYAGPYRYEVEFILDNAEADRYSILKWSADKARVQTKHQISAPAEQTALTINHFTVPGTPEAFGTVLYSENNSNRSSSYQLNYRQQAGDQNLYMQSGLAMMSSTNRVDIVSRGYAGAAGGYLSSEVTTGESKRYKRKERRREIFTPSRQLDAADLCSNTAEGCTHSDDWQPLVGATPEDSGFYRSDNSIRAILDQKSVIINGVTDEPDALVLIERSKIEFPQIAYAMTPDFSRIPPSINVIHTGLGLSSATGYAGEMLCRITPMDSSDGRVYGAYCSGTYEQLSNAVVISESYEFGSLTTEHLPSVDIIVQ